MHDYTGKVVLITGAGRGLGRALAEAFAANGAVVAANDITPINLDETIARIAAVSGQGKDYIFDVAKRMPVQALVAQVVEDWGQIDILINHAAVQPTAAILDMDEWDWLRTMDVNINGAFFLTQAVGRVMAERNGGNIIHLSPGIEETATFERKAAYLTSKAGLPALVRAAAQEFAAYTIHVNLVCPENTVDTIKIIDNLCSV